METEEYIYLIGRPSISDFIAVVQEHTSEGADIETLTGEWRRANDRVKELEKTEAGFCHHQRIYPVPQKLEHLLEKIKQDESLKKAISALPYEFGYVELDKLIVHQKQINLDQVKRIKQDIGSNPSDEMIFETCLPLNNIETPATTKMRLNATTFDFSSVSEDFRILDFCVLNKDQIKNYVSPGMIAGVVAVVVGYGMNCITAVSINGQLILNNGSHRAYALRDMGITHVPCVIQKITRKEEMELTTPQIAKTVQQYNNSPRPPAFKDYFDSRLSRVLRLPSKKRHVQVSYKINQFDLPH